MKAIIQTTYGDETTLRIDDVSKPIITKPNHILIQVKVANISSGDKNINTIPFGFPLNVILRLIFGWKGPRRRIRGISGSGIIEHVGVGVKGYKPGDHVNFISSMKASVMADYVLLDDRSVLALVDASVPYEQSAPMAFGALTADYFLNEKTIRSKDRVLIYGASGAVGTYASYLVKQYDGHLTGVFRHHHQEALRGIPFDAIVDYQTTSMTPYHGTFDVVFDAVGKLSKKEANALLKKGGRFVSVKQPTKESKVRLTYVNALLHKGSLKTIVDTVYPFKAFQEAHRHVYSGHKTGNVVLILNE
jgi:NADPH:quinone reductase-like Zn-dependent oxidoreductase